MLNALYDIFFDVTGSVLVMVSIAFAAFTLLAAFVSIGYIRDKTLDLKEKLVAGGIMIVITLWGAWLTQFAYHLGVACLTN
jgi:type III secretory pathway component EscS